MTFQSPLLDPENLRLAAEDDPDALVGRVCARRKPVAFVDHRRWRPLATLADLAQQAGLATRLRRSVFTEDGPRPIVHFFLSVAMTDVIGEAVDLDDLAREYSRLLPDLPDVVRQISLELERLRPMRFSDFLEFRDVEIGMRSLFGEEGYSVYEYARTGLLLGYPVESTCEVMRRMFAERSAYARTRS